MNIFDESLSDQEIILLQEIAPSGIKVNGLSEKSAKVYSQVFIDSLWVAFEEARVLMAKDFTSAVQKGRALLNKSLSRNRAFYC